MFSHNVYPPPLPSVRGRGSVVPLPPLLLPWLPHHRLEREITIASHCLEVTVNVNFNIVVNPVLLL